MRLFFQRGGGWVLAQFGLMLGVGVLAVAFPGHWGVGGPVAGVCLLLVGAGLGIAGARALGRNRTPFLHPREGAQLVQRGIYAWVRHPLYTSVMLLALGWACVWQSGPALTVAVLLIPFFVAKARTEERWLRAQFPAYEAYRRAVPAFVPWWGRRRRMPSPPNDQTPTRSVTH